MLVRSHWKGGGGGGGGEDIQRRDRRTGRKQTSYLTFPVPKLGNAGVDVA